ncbi:MULTISPECIES: GTPase [Actinomyces]|uniref:50S ribosome-binding GTPase n=1 Tax=Actinomyces respiraculi TaxID=2744574 RepID=A0A7T0LNE6_9ACTO|nr:MULTISPECIES: GTPase [Actinomyces]QPL06423.1 50S ribosome-binding GTPase [Actinomyces respiraculi]
MTATSPDTVGARSSQDPLALLARLVEIGDGLLPAEVLDPARDLIERAGQRRLIAPGIQVVALLGATGSGKSSLFNAVCGADLAPTAVTRPTTTQPLAALPAQPSAETVAGAARLLDWLEVDQRVQLPETPSWGPAAVGVGRSTVLLDLPDIDSDTRHHRVVAERLASLVDVLVWVLDPEKYADAVIHHDFIAPMAEHAAVAVVALNQVDRLGRDERQQAVRDLTRLLAQEGLADIDVVEVSARTGEGVQELRVRIRQVAESDDVTARRLAADARTLAARARDSLRQQASYAQAVTGDGGREALEEVARRGAGTERVAKAVEASMRLEAARRVGWLPLRWLVRLRVDPLRRLHLGDAAARRPQAAGEEAPVARTSAPAMGAAESSALRAAAHAYVVGRSRDLHPEAQDRAVERCGTGVEELADRLDAAVARTDLEQGKLPRWWTLANVLQVLLALVALVGGGWLVVLHVMSHVLLLTVDPPRWGIVPWPTLLLVGGLAVGLVLSWVGTLLARVGASRRGARVRRRLNRAVAQVVGATLVEPLEEELARLEEVSALLERLR